MELELDPARLVALRERFSLPLHAAAKRSGLSETEIAELEIESRRVPVDTARRLAKAYNRNWYVFLLEDEPGLPAVPHDFRRIGRRVPVSADTLIAFDDAAAVVSKILDLPREHESPAVTLRPIDGLSAEEAAAQVRKDFGITADAQRTASAEYDTIRLWANQLSRAGLYVAQMSFPYREVRAFCIQQDGVSLIVVSTQDGARARVFSMLHELGHVLRGHPGMCQPESSAGGDPSQDEEVFCNAFAAALLMPAEEFAKDPEAQALAGRRLDLGDALRLANRWGVSELAALRRLTVLGLLAPADYDRLHQARAEEFADEPVPDPNSTKIRGQHTRMVYDSSRLYAAEVLDAHARGDISLRDIGVLLGGNLKHLPKIREELAR